MQPNLQIEQSLGLRTASLAEPVVVRPQNDINASRELELLTQAAVKFESFFVAQMMQQMRKATAALADADSPLNVEAHQAPLAMADHAVADNLASTGAFGIANVLVQQMAGPLLPSPSLSPNLSIPMAGNKSSRNAT